METILFLVGLLIAPGLLVQGQPALVSADSTPASRGYWRVFTEAQSRTTLVRFFDPAHQLV